MTNRQRITDVENFHPFEFHTDEQQAAYREQVRHASGVTGGSSAQIRIGVGQEDCQTCGGIGYLSVLQENGDSRMQSCVCRAGTETELARLLRQSGIPESRRNLSVFLKGAYGLRDYPGRDAANELAVEFTNAALNSEIPHGIAFIGVPGSGKTWIGQAIVSAILQQQREARYMTIPRYLDMLKETFGNYRDSETTQAIRDRYGRVPVLVIDELEMAKASEWAIEQIFTLANVRNEGATTVDTTGATSTVWLFTPRGVEVAQKSALAPVVSRAMMGAKHGYVCHIEAGDLRPNV